MRQFARTHAHWAGSRAAFRLQPGALWLRLHEANDSFIHLMRWHYLPMIDFGIAGLWLGKILRW